MDTHLRFDRLEAFARDRLPPAGLREIMTHLEQCPECRKRYSRFLAREKLARDLRRIMGTAVLE